jgi:alpha-tubulin suppressor-like RCC1 family protein
VAALYHTCALGGGGVAYCWGDNDFGRLGDGTTTDRFTPRPVSGEATFTSLTAGITHTCGITVAGEARCWGNNGIGQLGNPAAGTESHVPLAVAAPNGGPPLTFVLLTAGGQHTCGLTSDGGAWCWGRNSEGQLGDGSQQSQTAPVPVAGTLTFGTLSANANHTCGVTRAGAAYCWGSNNDGELGNGTTTFGPTPIAVSGGLWFIAVGAGGSGPFGTPHTCGITTTNATYCWGDNSSGQLGDGTTTNRLVPTLVSGAAFIQLDAGQRFTCALASGGLASCWGINLGGQLGTGDFSPRSTPTAVTGPGGGTALAFAAITAGVAHTCGRTTAAAIYCWGGNADGQVGQDGGATRTSPILVSLGGPALSDLTLASTEVPLEGFTNYRAVVANPGSASNKILQGYIYQGDGYRAAGGTVFAMNSGLSGVDFAVVASNSAAGTVTLAPGPANFVLQLLSFDGGTTYDTRTIPITITAP